MKRSMLVSLSLLGALLAAQADAQVAFRDVSKHPRGQAAFDASANACSAATGESPESAAYRQCMSKYGYRVQTAAPAQGGVKPRGMRSAAAECAPLEALFGCGATTPAQASTRRQARASKPVSPPREAVDYEESSSPSPTVSDSSSPSPPSPPPVDQTGMDTMNQANMAMAQQQVLIDAQIAQQTEQAANLTTNFGQ